MPDVVSRSSKCLSSLVTISFYDPIPLIGLVRALKILPLQNFSYKISIHITVEIKRDFWRYLVQLSVQAESPRAGCSGPPTVTFGYLQKWIFYSLSSQSVPVLTHSHSKKRWFFYGQKSVLMKSINTIILANKNSFSREPLGILVKNKKPESSFSKSRKLSLLVHATAM